MAEQRGFVLRDTYFRRVFIPIVLALLIFASIIVIVRSTPGGTPNWETYGSVFGAKQLGGAWKKLAGATRR
jgi:hypothetical protein